MARTLANTLQLNFSDTAARHLVGALFGLTMTAALFWMMQYLIETADRVLAEESTPLTLDFVRLLRDEPVQKKPREIVKPPEYEPPPDLPRPDNLNDAEPTIGVSDLRPPDIPVGQTDGPRILDVFGEGDYLPIVKVEPIYPARALSRGIEGHCVIQFTVTRNGTVRDPFVVESQCTHSVFQRASLDAVLKFKYKPRVIDGVQMDVPGVQNKFIFRITD